MNKEHLYRIRHWWFWVVVAPLVLAGAVLALAATVKTDVLAFDGSKYWWTAFAIPIGGLLLVYGAWRRRLSLDRFTSGMLAPLLASRYSPRRAVIRGALLVGTLAFIVAATLGPRWGMYLEKQKAYGIDVVVAFDVSRSMLVTDVTPNRLERAKRELRQQLVERGAFQQGSRLALIAFAGTTSLKVPLTTDHLAFQKKLDALNVGSVPRGGTAIAEAIRSGTDLLSKSPEHATKVILVVTDGEDHEGGPVEAAEAAHKEQNINVFCIGVGDASRTAGAEVPGPQGGKPLLYDGQIVFSKLDVDQLRKISMAGGGTYAPLDELPRLVTRMASMKKTELSVEERVRHKPQYQWFLLAGMILLAIETMLSELRSVAADEPSRVWQLEPA